MLALFVAVFVASLLGSMHCAGMCGAFVAFAVAGTDGTTPARWKLNAAYNGGRLVTYVVLGAASGLVGSAIDLGTSAAGLQRGAAIVAGAMMIGFAAVAILRASGVRLPRAPVPAVLQRTVAAGHRAAFTRPPFQRALAIGMLTTLLPCGWLYAFAITAAGTASPLKGAAAMAAFWLGTLPMMAAIGAGVQAVAGPLRTRLPLATAVLLAAVGIWTIVGRLHLPTMSSASAASSSTTSARVDHEAPTASEAIDRVRHLGDQKPPCCNGG
ncbi:MAG: sulfite exporter TauE/SafE family protein [Phycisphaerales bacterium]|nr:sulfite exporter TauE/SafE family protein [Phycisphaerales bacterium]